MKKLMALTLMALPALVWVSTSLPGVFALLLGLFGSPMWWGNDWVVWFDCPSCGIR